MMHAPPAGPSDVTAIAAADPAAARAHFAAKLAFETDCADVQAAFASGRADFVLIDVRGPAAFARGHVPGALNIPRRELDAGRLAGFAGRLLVAYCAGPHCNGADKAALALAELGLPAKIMIGGLTGWRDEGFAVATGAEPASD